MSFYNMMNGMSPLTIFVLPMLDLHPNDIPRFRACFLQDEEHPEYDNFIHIYTRVGGGNRGCDFGEDEFMEHPNFVDMWDDSFDSTYGTYVFSVPEKWKKDFELIKKGKMFNISQEYKEHIKKIFPKMIDKIDALFVPAVPEDKKD